MAWESQVTNPFESIPDPDEEFRQIEEIAALTIRLLERRYPAPNSILRAVHPKSHGCLHAQFEVRKDLAKEHQVGLFSHPGAAYDAVVRFSNADTFVRADLRGGENGSRGMAIKIFDVPGDADFGKSTGAGEGAESPAPSDGELPARGSSGHDGPLGRRGV